MVSIPFAFCGPTSIAGGQALPPRPLVYYLALGAFIYYRIRALGAFATLSDLQALGAFVQCCDSMSLHLATKWLWEPICNAVTSCGSMSLRPLSSGSGSLILVVKGLEEPTVVNCISFISFLRYYAHYLLLCFLSALCATHCCPQSELEDAPPLNRGAARDPPSARCLVHQVRVEERWRGGRQQVGHRLEWKIFERMGTGEEWVGQKSKKPPREAQGPPQEPQRGGGTQEDPPGTRHPARDKKRKNPQAPPQGGNFWEV